MTILTHLRVFLVYRSQVCQDRLQAYEAKKNGFFSLTNMMQKKDIKNQIIFKNKYQPA